MRQITPEATTARARQFPENTLIAKDKEKVVGFAVYGPSRDADLTNAGEAVVIYVLSEYYGRKIGYRLMNEAVSRLGEYDTILVWVLEKMRERFVFITKCIDICPCKALKNRQWTIEKDRSEIIDYQKCNRMRSAFIKKLDRKNSCGLYLAVRPFGISGQKSPGI